MSTNRLAQIKEARESKTHNLNGELYFNMFKQIVSDCIDAGFHLSSPFISYKKDIIESTHNTSTIPYLLDSFSHSISGECGEAFNAMKNDVYSSSNYYVSQGVQAYYDQIKVDVVNSLGQIADTSIEL